MMFLCTAWILFCWMTICCRCQIRENIALRRMVFSKTRVTVMELDNTADKLVDGDQQTCITGPTGRSESWWTVELRQHYQVDMVRVVMGTSWISGFEVSSRPNISVQVGNTPDTPTPCDFVHQHVEEGSGTTWTTKTATFTCSPPVEGRYVSLSDLGEMARQCEVEVYARNTQVPEFNWSCGTVLTDAIGWFQSVDHDGDGIYDNNIDCWWLISTDLHYAIELNITHLDVEDHEICGYDFLKVYDGAVDDVGTIGQYCGYVTPNVITSRYNNLYIHFHSDEGLAGSGFNATYYSFYVFGCGAVYENRSSYLTHTVDDLNATYNDGNITCTWVIMAADEPQQMIELNVLNVSVLEGRTHDHNILKVFEGKIADYALIGSYSKGPKPTDVILTSSIMYVQFKAAIVNLSVRYSVRCAAIFQNNSGLNFGSVDRDNDGSYEHNSDCSWTILVEPFNAIHLYIRSIDVEHGEHCQWDYIEVFDGTNSQDDTLGKFCGYVPPPMVASSGNSMLVQFVSDGSVNEAGFKATFMTVCQILLTEPNGSFCPLDENLNGLYDVQNCTWIIRVDESKSIQLNITDIDIDARDYIQVYDSLMEERFLLEEIYGSHQQKLFKSSFNIVYVQFRADWYGKGFNATYTSVDRACGVMMREPSDWFLAPDHDNDGFYDANVDCKWIIYIPGIERIRFTVQNMDIQQFENCDLDYLEVYEFDWQVIVTLQVYQKYNLIRRYCGDEDPTPLEINAVAVQVVFHSSSMINGGVFNASYTSFDPKVRCGAVINAISGWIASTDTDNDSEYDNNQDCLWTLNAEPNHVVLFRVMQLDLEWTHNCEYDYMKVYELETVAVADHICEQNRHFSQQPYILSANNVVYVKFVSDDGVTGAGFKLFYVQVLPETVHYTEAFRLYSCFPKDQDSDGYYDNYQDMLWYVYQQSVYWMEIRFIWIDIQNSNSCQLDFLELYDDIVRKGIFCGTITPQVTMTICSELHMHFHSDDEISGTGFNLSYSLVPEIHETCIYNDILTEETGRLVAYDGDDDGLYDHNLNCKWTIESSANEMVKLHILDIDIQYDDSCSLDYLEISESWQLGNIDRYCGTVPPPVITSASTSLVVRFVSDYAIHGRGFNATYWFEEVVCGGILNETSGTFRPLDRNGDGLYDNTQDCWWTLVAAQHQTLTLNFVFVQLWIGYTSNCDYYDWIKVYENGTLIDVLCSQSTNTKYITTMGFDVNFYADRNGNEVGFLATYEIADVQSCGSEINSEVGWISFPDRDGDGFYDNNMMCTWRLGVNKSEILELYIAIIGIECGYDYLEVRSKVFCGEDKTYQMVFTDTQVNIHFFSDPNINDKGFNMTYNQHINECNQTCGSNVSDVSQYFSPLDCDVDGWYDFNLQCTWTITVENHQKVRLIISNVDLQEEDEDNYECIYDYIRIYDGYPEANDVLGTYCGNNDDIDVSSTQSTLSVRFSSYYMTVRTGFTATYTPEFKFDCGSIFTDSFGRFKPDDLDGDTQYDNNLDCLWIILASENKTTYVEFYNFDIEREEHCSFDYLKIYEGSLDDFTIQGTYCGYIAPPMVSSQQDLFIRFHSDFGITSYGFHAKFYIFAGSTFPAESSTVSLITSTKSTQSHTTKETSWTRNTLTTPSTPGSTLKTTSNLELTSNINSSNATSKHMSTDMTKEFATETYTSIDSTTNAATRIMENVTFDNTMPASISHPHVTAVENQSSISSSTTANQIDLIRRTNESELLSSSTTANQVNLTRRTTESEFTTTPAAGQTKSSYSLTVIAYGLIYIAYLCCEVV